MPDALATLRALVEDMLHGWIGVDPEIERTLLRHGVAKRVDTRTPCGDRCRCADEIGAGEMTTCFRLADWLREPAGAGASTKEPT